MAKCKGCGKWGLFLKLQNGLCSSCIDSLWSKDAKPLISKEEFLNHDAHKPLPPDPVVMRDTGHVPEGHVVAGSGEFLPVESLPDVFAVDGISRIDHNFYEITSAGNIERAREDILTMNALIEQANQKCSEVPLKLFRKEKINFRFSETAMSRDYCTLEFAPLTKTGKLSKYPIRLGVIQVNKESDPDHYDITGSIFYLKDGSVGKADLILHERVTLTEKVVDGRQVLQSNCTVYRLNIAVVDGALTVKTIYRNEAGFRQRIYSCE